MSIKVTIPDEDMKDPRIARAIVDLMNALGRAFAAGAISTSRPAPARRAEARPTTFAEFEEALPARSKRFIELLRERGTLRVQEVVDLLKLSSPKAVGGITGAIARWAPQRGLQLPYESTRIRGERAWRWLGGPATSAPIQPVGRTRSATAARPKPAPQKPRPKPAPEPAPTPVAREPEVPDLAPNLEGLLAALPDRSRRFVELLRDRHVVDMAGVLGELGLTRAAAVQDLLRPVRAMAAEFGFTDVFETTSNDTGGRVFLWPGTKVDVPAKVASLPVNASRGHRSPGDSAEGEVIPFEEPRAQQVAPGLMRRRRKSG